MSAPNRFQTSAVIDRNQTSPGTLRVRGASSLAMIRAVGAAIAVACGANADISFDAAESIPLSDGLTATCVALGDLDGDGDLDAVVTGRNGDGRIDLLRNDGAGAFEPFGELLAPTQTDWVELADLDADGALDVVVGVRAGVGRIVTWRNAGGGTFGDPISIRAVGRETRCLALADFDGDGLRDVAALAYGSGETLIERATSPFQFERAAALRIAPFANGLPSPQHVRAHDLDADGDPDLAAISIGTSRLLLSANDGAGVFGPWRSWRAPLVGGIRGGSAGSAIADFDGDGALDFAIPQTTFGTQYLVVFRGDGSGGVADSVTFQTAPQGPSWFPLAADFDDDGDPDLVITTALPGQVIVLENVTRPGQPLAFSDAFFDIPSQFIRHAATGDVDDDGDLDLVVADISVDRLLLYRNGSTAGSSAAATDGGPASVVTDARLDADVTATNGVAPARAAAEHAAIVVFLQRLADVRRGELGQLADDLAALRGTFAGRPGAGVAR